MTEFDHWIERWQQGMTGWHRAEINPRLLDHGESSLPEPSGTVFVPLCGASLDMLWLRNQGHRVVGVDISELAALRFFEQAELSPQVEEQQPFKRFASAGIEFWVGDFFALDAARIGPVDMTYDRASLIAMPRQRRPDYARQLAAMTGHAPVLLVTLEYDQDHMQGPPFSVAEPEVHELFGDDYRVERLIRDDVLPNEPRFRERGLQRLHECVYQLTGK